MLQVGKSMAGKYLSWFFAQIVSPTLEKTNARAIRKTSQFLLQNIETHGLRQAGEPEQIEYTTLSELDQIRSPADLCTNFAIPN
jgi:hypothetical protein